MSTRADLEKHADRLAFLEKRELELERLLATSQEQYESAVTTAVLERPGETPFGKIGTPVMEIPKKREKLVSELKNVRAEKPIHAAKVREYRMLETLEKADEIRAAIAGLDAQETADVKAFSDWLAEGVRQHWPKLCATWRERHEFEIPIADEGLRLELRDSLRPRFQPLPHDFVAAVELVLELAAFAEPDGTRTNSNGRVSRNHHQVSGILGLYPDLHGEIVYAPDFGGGVPSFASTGPTGRT